MRVISCWCDISCLCAFIKETVFHVEGFRLEVIEVIGKVSIFWAMTADKVNLFVGINSVAGDLSLVE